MIAVSQPLDGEVARGGITVEITNRESAVPERALCDEKFFRCDLLSLDAADRRHHFFVERPDDFGRL